MKKIKALLTTKHLKTTLTYLLIATTAIGILLQSYQKLETPLVRADFVSTLVPGIAYFHGLGSPYLNYWEIRPPALQLMTGLWGITIGSSLKSFHILYLLFFTGIMTLSWLIINRLFSFYEKVLVYSIFATIFFTNSVQTQFFPPEINGLLFSLAGLYFALNKNPSNKHIFLSSFFFIIASQMKEVFAFTGLSLFPHLIIKLHAPKKQLIQFIASVGTGIAAAITIVLAYLTYTQALTAYNQILEYKSQIFDPTNIIALTPRIPTTLTYLANRFLAIPYNPLLLIPTTILTITLWLKDACKITPKKKQHILHLSLPHQLTTQIHLYSITICYTIGSFTGYLMQNRYNHIYDIAIILPFILILSLTGKTIAASLIPTIPFKKFQNPTFALIFSLLSITTLIIPQKQIFTEDYHQLKNYNLHTHLARWNDTENPTHIQRELKIKNLTPADSCIDVQHGWNVGQQYYYAGRRPCTRFFITNILPPSKIPEYQTQLTNNPPAALINFTTLTDLNIEHFEQNIFNFTKVINTCFIQDEEFPNLYWPALPDDEFKTCFKTGLPTKPTP